MKKTECKTISKPKGIVFGTLYLPIIQNACSSDGKQNIPEIMLYLPIIQNTCSSEGTKINFNNCCTYPSFRMHVHP